MAVTDRIRVIDSDTHVVEPYDLWTSRMATKWGDKVPHVVWSEREQQEIWLSGDNALGPAAALGHAGSGLRYPDLPKKWDELDPAAVDAGSRLRLMDEYGIYAAVIYSNVLGFGAGNFATTQSNEGSAFALQCIQAYNDFLIEYAANDPQRLAPIMGLPFWDVDLSIAEMHRCYHQGHKGIAFPQFPEFYHQPRLAETHWDRLWGAAQEAELPVNFHIVSGGQPDRQILPEEAGRGANSSVYTMLFSMENARTVASIICGGVCHRFPKLKFVSVESGVGWVPFALQGMDWMWTNSTAREEHPEYDLLPSEYFRRQVYACFWYEYGPPLEATIAFVGADNILYETDFPHPTCMAPGPGTSAVSPQQCIDQNLSHLPDEILQKILHDNAASLYHLD
jgi:uncharacterized protein